MSRIGKLPIQIPSGVTLTQNSNNISVKGPKGSLDFTHSSQVTVSVEDGVVHVKPNHENAASFWGTTRAIIQNMIIGVTAGFQKSLEINGVGYKFEIQGKTLVLSVGFSHKVEISIPDGIEVKADEKLKNVIHISGIDKQFVGEFASKIKFIKKPEPYKGKGIKYQGELIRRKAGKSGKK